jgi:X-Pro dipeptidyl-peptidase
MAIAAAAALALALAAPAAAATGPAASPAVAATGGAARTTTNTISEQVWVQTKVDTDGDGKKDRVRVFITRPDSGKVATILEATPYYDCCRDVPNHDVDVEKLPQEGLFSPAASQIVPGLTGAVTAEDRAAISADIDARMAHFAARGYATVVAQTIGTADSTGCPTIGDKNEVLSVKAVIQRLAGKGKAFDDSGKRVKAKWSTHHIGMMGVSYDGTLPQMVATTGVKGLDTIVPISAISSWYDYYRANGLVVAPGGYQGEDTDVLARFNVATAQQGVCEALLQQLEEDQDRVTGDYSPFWKARDYVGKAKNIKASVFVVHGINDWNVKTQHVGQFWKQLAKHDIARKIWWHHYAHGGPAGDTSYELPDGTVTNYTQTVDRWMDYWLYGDDTGIMDEPRAIIQREDLDYLTYADWPDPAMKKSKVALSSLTSTAVTATQTFEDDGRARSAEALIRSPGRSDDNRLVFTTKALDEDTRLSGTPTVKLKLSIDDHKDANVTALLVDYEAGKDAIGKIITRGWMDPQNRHGDAVSKKVKKGKAYTLTFGLEPKDYVFPAGHRIGLVIISTDQAYTLRPDPGTHLTLTVGKSSVTLPIVGGL